MNKSNFETKILDFKEDMGKGKDGRLTIEVKKYPADEKELINFLEWLGNEFIGKGGLYAVDIVAVGKGKYRVCKSNHEKNKWIEYL